MSNRHSTYILRALRLMMLAVALVVPSWVGAAVPWDGVSSEPFAEGDGTKAKPYIISSPAHLCYLAQNNCPDGELWLRRSTQVFYKQVCDIDLGGHPLPATIGNGDKDFRNAYDGQGFRILNARIEINSVDGTNKSLSYGLFGYLYNCTVRNMVIENATVAFKRGLDVNVAYDLKVGILAGAVGPAAKIQNLRISGSRITAGDVEYDASNNIDENGMVKFTTLFVGGAVGDISSGFAGSGVSTSNLPVIRNIHAGVDFDFANAKRKQWAEAAKATQFNVGGIVGRLRKQPYSVMPDNTFYTGSVNAPNATVSPVWGASRSNVDRTQQAQTLAQAYSGEFHYGSGADDFTWIGRENDPSGHEVTDATAKTNRYFGDYKIHDCITETDITVTADNLETSDMGTRTVATMPRTGTFALDSKYMMGFQGVSHATYAPSQEPVVDMFNAYSESTGTKTDLINGWWVDGAGAIQMLYPVNFSFKRTGVTDFTVTVPHGRDNYIVKLYSGDTLLETVTLEAPNDGSDTYSHTFVRRDVSDISTLTAKLFDAYGAAIPSMTDKGSCGDDIAITLEVAPLLEYLHLSVDRITNTTPAPGESSFYYLASMIDSDSEVIVGGGSKGTDVATLPQFGWLWEVSSDPTSQTSWEKTDLHHWYDTEIDVIRGRNWIVPYQSDRFYRVSFCELLMDADGNYLYDVVGGKHVLRYRVLTQEVMGAENLIFVYDKTKTEFGRRFGITSFTGKDRSTSDDEALQVEFPDGDDANNGMDPYHAVKTMKRAYELIDPSLGRDGNVIIIMGFQFDYQPHTVDGVVIDKGEQMTWDPRKPELFAGACTVTGSRGRLIYDGAISMKTSDTSNPPALGGSTAFNNIAWVGYAKNSWYRGTLDGITSVVRGDGHLYAALHDLYIGEKLKVIGFKNADSTLGLISGTIAPALHIVAGIHNYRKEGVVNPADNQTPGVTTLTIKSGCFARIICGARNHATVTSNNNIFGSPDQPHRVTLNVSITHPQPKTGNFVPADYYDAESNYNYDIGMITGGQTDGSLYADVSVNMHEGYIGRYISGNISYGRNTNPGFPSDSFYGNTEINFTGGEIYELYGGSLGRHAQTGETVGTLGGPTEKVEGYFYGRSAINIMGGRISSNIYGAGAGGVAGVGDKDYHTDDVNIPYRTSDGGLLYGDWGAVWDAAIVNPDGSRTLTVPSITLRDGTELDLVHSTSEVNLSGGEVYGDIYGGGYGYSNSASFDKALSLAGNLFGNARVTMKQGTGEPPVLRGNLYGGGCGSRQYYLEAKAAFNNPGHKLHDYATTHFDTPEHKTTLDDWATYFGRLGCVVGNTEVILEAGTVWGNVYGAGGGINEFINMAAVIGNTKVVMGGSTGAGATVNGNIFGGSKVADIYHHKGAEYADKPEHSGNCSVEISRGVVGNSIFGGCEGYYTTPDDPMNSSGHVYGSTSVRILGGSYIAEPYSTDINGDYIMTNGHTVSKSDYNPSVHKLTPRSFNTYGGGYVNSIIMGSTNVYMERSLLADEASLEGGDFNTAFKDLLYRRFCVYGGGWGEHTEVRGLAAYMAADAPGPLAGSAPSAARIHINVVEREFENNLVAITDEPLTSLKKNQTFFDIAGGGYSGNVGYWTRVDYEKEGDDYKLDADGERIPIESTRKPIYELIEEGASLTVDDYCEYVNGDVSIRIEGQPFIRKVVGGGFYASVNNTDTRIFQGSIGEVYGGALLGYVHQAARLQIGTLYDSPDFTPEQVRQNHKRLFIRESVYGGNDVKGIIGTMKWSDLSDSRFDPNSAGTHGAGLEQHDSEPLFTADIKNTEDHGVNLFLFGGTVMGNVYGAGNGHYRGYYVPGWLRYNDGTARQYCVVRSTIPEYDGNRNVTNYLLDAEGKPTIDPTTGDYVYTGKVYRSQPMVGSVKMYIGGNAADDRVTVLGSVYGGGRSCTIGQWNTVLPFSDPRRLSFGGYLNINFGSHVYVDKNLYLGVSGAEYAKQNVVPSDITDLKNFAGATTQELDRLGDVAYGPWYFDRHRGHYMPGFPPPGDWDGNFGMMGDHMFRAYMKKIEMNANVSLSFYTDPFAKDADGNHIRDEKGRIVRQHWVPGEIAVAGSKDNPNLRYDSENVHFGSMFVGGECGSMTNNRMMIYNYTKDREISADDRDLYPADDHEKWGSIYRITLPYGVTIRDKVVGGSENAVVEFYDYNEDGTALVTTDGEGKPLKPSYRFEGGLVTQASDTYDLIVYTDQELWKNDNVPGYVPKVKGWDVEISAADYMADAASHGDTYVLKTVKQLDGAPITIHRYRYNTTNPFFTNINQLDVDRYSLAYTSDGTRRYGFTSPRSLRRAYLVARDGDQEQEEWQDTAVKMSIFCEFDPQEGLLTKTDGAGNEVDMDPDNHFYRYGGVIYGGCFNSGLTYGDIIINCASNMLGNRIKAMTSSDKFEWLSSLKYNVGRVFGGGYGRDSRVEGDVYINLLHNFLGMNVFGGGCRGDVVGASAINYVGAEDKSYVYGSIYGGGLYGSVGADNLQRPATWLHLVSGNVKNVYGGSCLGNLYGRAQVDLCEQVEPYYDHFDYRRVREISEDFDTWAGSRLIVGSVFGGNDVSGNIYRSPMLPENHPNYDPDAVYSTIVTVREEQKLPNPTPKPRRITLEDPEDTEGAGDAEDVENVVSPGKESPGADNGYNAFPLIGNLYGGSNGNYGTHRGGKHTEGSNYYIGGTLQLAVGAQNQIMTLNLGGGDRSDGIGTYGAFELPHLTHTCLRITGGTIINAYGGGDLSTVEDLSVIEVDYKEDAMNARAGFSGQQEIRRLWNTLQLSGDEQLTEVSTVDSEGNTIFNHHVFRLFGGNNSADMHIQPEWHLTRAHVGAVYSGGNFGRMTHCAVTTDDEGRVVPEHGIYLPISSGDFHAVEVYGGGRVGDVAPDFVSAGVDPELLDDNGRLKSAGDFYGAKLEITDGVIDHVYGGNDVSGNVEYGTKVLIHGAISGDVYCAGNGNYRYRYEPTLAPGSKIREEYDNMGARYFLLPRIDSYGGTQPGKAQRLLAINSYRPNVERAYLSLSGSDADHPAYVRGAVYCGGNSSSVHPTVGNEGDNTIIFNVGDNVVLNSVFLGSNGENLLTNFQDLERLNGLTLDQSLDLAGDNDLSTTDFDTLASDDPALRDLAATDKRLYPSLLDVCMRAVEVYSLPKDFELKTDLKNAYIGDFFVGGNRGSVMTDKCIYLTFPESLVIFGKIVGGSNNANIVYKSVTHNGGLPAFVDHTPYADGHVNNEKVHLVVKSRFEPWKLGYPIEGDYRRIAMEADVERLDDGTLRFPHNKCSVYGGCFNSGRVVGDVFIDLYSDMLEEYTDVTTPGSIGKALNDAYGIDGTYTVNADGTLTNREKKSLIINGINEQKRSFAVVGGGFGEAASVVGNIHVRMLPGTVHPTYNATATDDKPYVSPKHPSCAALFGGSERGYVVGNTYVEVRDGQVLGNTYGASEANMLFGSTHTIIGWPEYYRVKEATPELNTQRLYTLKRADDLSKAAKGDWDDASRPAAKMVIDDIPLRPGDIITPAVYRAITDPDKEQCFDYVADDLPQNFKTIHEEVYHHDAHPYNNADWDDISISIGDQRSRTDNTAPYYGHGNVYGGGFVSAGSSTSLAGQNTVRRFVQAAHPNLLVDRDDTTFLNYGGNSMIMIWDNKENADLSRTPGADPDGNAIDGGEDAIIDHISIGTGRYVKVAMTKGQDTMGKFVYDPVKKRYIHQSPHILGTDINGEPIEHDPMMDQVYYKIESDGGIYGGGRKVFVEGFRSCDLAYYGYADCTPQFAKLINTIQRLDMLTLTDCCLQLQGANDFTTDNVDATDYSLTHIGEMQMRSSIPPTMALSPGVREEDGLYNIIHDQKRMRNYVSFYNSVLYVSAITSSESFTEGRYRGASGEFNVTGDWGSNANPTIDVTDIETRYPAYTDVSTVKEGQYSYMDYKLNRINNYYAFRPTSPNDDTTENVDIRNRTSLEFDQRNVGTAANMIGINNGFTLKIQGLGHHDGVDELYHGPVMGVFEVKLLTLARNEGGGYIFALNCHDKTIPGNELNGQPAFLESTGNFVFPGAAYMAQSDKKYNYIDDDCFPMGKGWESYYHWYQAAGSQSQRREGETHGDCNEQEVHYWYVNGSNFYYNVTLTAYTYNGESDFTLDNIDQLVYLYGVEPGTKLVVKDVKWSPSTNTYPDLQNPAMTEGNYDKDYRLYLSIDKNSSAFHNVDPASPFHNHSFVTPIPRADYNKSTVGWNDDPMANPATMTVNNYSDYDESDNIPLVGISLRDYVDNSQKTYYEAHLKEPETVRVELATVDAEKSHTYVVNLKIKYLLGPTISGLPVIENGALPGEYIYANAFDVKIELDDDIMAVTGNNWYVCAPEYSLDSQADIENVIKGIDNEDPELRTVAECINTERFDGERQVHIPAYLYRNGWHLVYEVIANNKSFYLHPDINSSNPIHPQKPYANHLVVHNYHRMCPYDGTSTTIEDGYEVPRYEDLKIVRGARIYIEDDKDMEFFYTWLKKCQSERAEHSPRGYHINPQYGDSLTVYLMKNVKLNYPAGMTEADVRGLQFNGTFHGNGYTIDMGANKLFLGTNSGHFYNTGFICSVSSKHNEVVTNNAMVFNENRTHLVGDSNVGGVIENCFLYNEADADNGYMLNPAATGNGSMVNCYLLSPNANKEVRTGLTCTSPDDFKYGKVAYNLNRFYLNRRFYDKRRNDPTASASDLDEAEATIGVVSDIYYDGEYRFARWSTDGQPTALRTRDIPNYLDFNGIRRDITSATYGPVTGADASFHNGLDPIDESRGRRDEGGDIIVDQFRQATYEPLEEDYFFFSQNMSDIDELDKYPRPYEEINRVYRSSGFYGSAVDKGFYFNIDANAFHPDLTAIDFTGLRSAQYGNVYLRELRSPADEEYYYYPPMLDMPEAGLTSFITSTREYDLSGREVPDEHVTRNLLVYTWPSHAVLTDYEYTRDTAPTDIYCHLINPKPGTGGLPLWATEATPENRPTTELLHLVDYEDFNCPVAFEVTDKAWYQRRPDNFADVCAKGYTGWDGIVLPFTVDKVFAQAENNPSHGELTHFYGLKREDQGGLEEEAPSHEYWLRKFTGVSRGDMLFDRPASEDDLDLDHGGANANPQEKTRNYYYNNPYFSDVYARIYDDGTTHSRPEYRPYDPANPDAEIGRTYMNYPLITERFPYIVTWPGEYFYEFDLSGAFYAEKFPANSPEKQVINFVAYGKDNTENYDREGNLITDWKTVIPVTDLNRPETFSHDEVLMTGTFKRLAPTADGLMRVIDRDGCNFVRPDAGEKWAVMPFRTYVATTSSFSKPMPITSRGIDHVGDIVPDQGGDEDEAEQLEIFVEDNVLVIMSPFEEPMDLPLFDTTGRLVRYLHVIDGENKYPELTQGFYIVRKFKFGIM